MNSKSQNHCSSESNIREKLNQDIHDNGNFDLFKYQLEDEQKIIILYILRNFPEEIKDEICEAIDLAIDKFLSEIDYEFYDESNSESDYNSSDNYGS